MPFDDKIDYDKLTVYVPNDLMNQTFEIIQKISPEEIKAKQQCISLLSLLLFLLLLFLSFFFDKERHFRTKSPFTVLSDSRRL